MKRIVHVLVAFALLMSVVVPPASAAGTRIIVRVNGGLPLVQTLCRLLRCNVNYGLGDPDGQVFLITSLTTVARHIPERPAAAAGHRERGSGLPGKYSRGQRCGRRRRRPRSSIPRR